MGSVIEKPWGHEEVLCEYEGVKIKRLLIKRGMRLSEQYPCRRDETMVCVGGEGYIQLGDTCLHLSAGSRPVYIDKYCVHRVCAAKSDFTLIEVQRGICEDEDIVRLSDDFNRK